MGCHMRGSSAARPDGSGHAFRAGAAVCAGCNQDGTQEEQPSPAGRISARAAAIWLRLEHLGVVPSRGAAPPHALATPEARPISEPLARAERNARLVLEDPAAWVHNGPYARALLDEAERALEVGE